MVNSDSNDAKFIDSIIKTMKNYEPIHFPKPGDRHMLIGSNIPNSWFKYNGQIFYVRMLFDNEPGSGKETLFLTAVDEKGKELEALVASYPVWSWRVKGSDKIEEELKKLEGKHIYYSGIGGEIMLSVFREEDVPSSSRKYGVKKIIREEYRPVFRIELGRDGKLINHIRSYFNYFRPNGKEEELSDELIHEILEQVARNIQPFVKNPELHPTLEEIERRMRPGSYSASGFLDENESLWNVINSDAKTLERHGISHDEIAQILDGVFKTFEGVPEDVPSGRVIYIGDTELKVEYFQTRGTQECPWDILDDWHKHTKGPKSEKYDSPDENFGFLGLKYLRRGSRDYKITNLKTRESIELGDMAAHLIGDHHFFEGNVPYRMDPEKLIRVLGLTKKTN